MYSMFLLAISAARKNIYITNPYFLPDASLRNALLAAAGRGVRVVALLPGEIDHSVVRQASRREFGRLIEAGIEIYEYRAGLLHSKTMVIDGVGATVGSTNFDNRSFALNEDLNVAVYNRDPAQRLEQVFTEDLAHSRRVELAQWQRRGLRARILQWMALPLWPQL
ncbi:MAG TPA: phospholipase D-like domain-containing protein [Candidatus Limnocylindrales bacterium]|nr:phospholipase D-like domain-containing protein [Candidatus Limnocylindrales bacterium]